jgi:hypothetical protein
VDAEAVTVIVVVADPYCTVPALSPRPPLVPPDPPDPLMSTLACVEVEEGPPPGPEPLAKEFPMKRGLPNPFCASWMVTDAEAEDAAAQAAAQRTAACVLNRMV